MTGSSDCMCVPPYNVSIVGYYNDEPQTNCKYLGIINGGTHCYFQEGTGQDISCEILEELDCTRPLPHKIAPEKQKEIVKTYFALFMYQTLYADNDANSIQQLVNQLQKDKNDGNMTVVDINC